MCAIVGFSSTNVTTEDIFVLKRVMVESRIRGKHASGIAWCNTKGSIESFVQPIPIDQLVETFDFSRVVNKGKATLIAHARYSTSDIKYNQPIVGADCAIVHNGVITQSDPSGWQETYGYKCKTKNDSELLLHCVEDGLNPYQVFPVSSFAAIVMNANSELIPIRNGLRPMWKGKIGKGIVYASTYDILRRAGVQNISKITCPDEDLQRRNWTQWETHRPLV